MNCIFFYPFKTNLTTTQIQSLPPKHTATQAHTQTMKAIFIPSLNPKTHHLITHYNFPITSSPSITTFTRFHSHYIPKCSSSSLEGGMKDVLSGMVDKRVEELLSREENRVLLDGLEKATQRVELAKKELAEIHRQEIEAAQLRSYVSQLETRESEIAECQKEINEARAMIEEADRSLSLNIDAFEGKEKGETNKDEERWESVKAASVSAIVGTLAGLPISLSQVSSGTELLLPLAINVASCALFGVTFRYTMRRDLDDIHLKTGTSAAFGFVKGLAALGAGPPLELSSASFLSHAVDGALYASENFVVFLFAAIGLDYCFKMKLLSPFPIKKSVSSGK